MKIYLAILFILDMLIYTCLVKLQVFLPVKTLLLLFIFTLLLTMYTSEVFAFIARHFLTVSVFVAIAILGTLTTLINDRDIGTIFGYFLSDVLQPFLILVCTYIMAQFMGPKFVGGILVGLALLTGLVAIAQFAGFQPAWQLRIWLDVIQDYRDELARPMGISLTPIIFSYHLAAAYGATNIFYRRQMLSPQLYIVIVGTFLVMAAVNGTRSLLLGIFLQEVVQLLLRRRMSSLLWLGALAIFAFVGLHYLETVGSRVASAADTSALQRTVLNVFGLRLAQDYPFGLGWGFQPGDLAWLYWPDLSNYVSSDSIFRLGLHNAYINIFLTYGVFSVVIAAFAVVMRPRKAISICSTFLAYFASALFHNDGLFIGDPFFWFAFGLLVYAWDMESVPQRVPSRRTGYTRASSVSGAVQ